MCEFESDYELVYDYQCMYEFIDESEWEQKYERVDTMCQERTLGMYSPCQKRTSNQEQTHSMSVVGFGIRFRLVILENLGIDHEIMGDAWVCTWYWNYFLNHFNHEWKTALGQNLAHSSAHFAC